MNYMFHLMRRKGENMEYRTMGGSDYMSHCITNAIDTEVLRRLMVQPIEIKIDKENEVQPWLRIVQSIHKEDIIGAYFNNKKMTTVIKWKDGTITKVKAQSDKGDAYNPEMGMAMCICKKALGNKSNFNEVFKKWLPKEYK